MVLGFNHNIQYKGETFHVQTEDSGIVNPHIITLLYRGGVIICSKKTNYADILKMENLEVVVDELMKEQHKDMMRRLKSGEFDEKAFAFKAQLIENYQIPTLEPEFSPFADLPDPATDYQPAKGDVTMLFKKTDQTAQAAATFPAPPKPEKTKTVVSLDDAILSFFESHEK
ncbi:MAG: hypothetical protein WCP20_18115 [Desulfuromonadales bacterium]